MIVRRILSEKEVLVAVVKVLLIVDVAVRV